MFPFYHENFSTDYVQNFSIHRGRYTPWWQVLITTNFVSSSKFTLFYVWLPDRATTVPIIVWEHVRSTDLGSLSHLGHSEVSFIYLRPEWPVGPKEPGELKPKRNYSTKHSVVTLGILSKRVLSVLKWTQFSSFYGEHHLVFWYWSLGFNRVSFTLHCWTVWNFMTIIIPQNLPF